MPDRLVIPEEMRARMVAHCLAARPDEGCGLFAVDGDLVTRVYPTGNETPSPGSFTVPPSEHYAALGDAEAKGWALGGVFHSHTQGDAVPSDRDVAGALDPEWIYIVIGLEGAVRIRAWRIIGGRPVEIPNGRATGRATSN